MIELKGQISIQRLSGKINIVPTQEIYDYTLHSKSVTPAAEDQTITPDSEYYGLNAVTVKGDENLAPENIKDGVEIFGIEGTHAGGDGAVFVLNAAKGFPVTVHSGAVSFSTDWSTYAMAETE